MRSPEERKRRHRNERIVAAIVVLVAAALTAGLWLYSQRLDEEHEREATYIPTPTVVTPEVELVRQYIRFDTSNPPGNEMPAAQWLAGLIRAAGLEAEVIESAPGRGNVYARIEGKRDGSGLLLLHHIDVAPAREAEWSHPPFEGVIRLDHLYGRGALDMKSVGIVFLRAFLDVAASGRQPEHDLVFLAVADEEAGGTWGMKWLLEHRPHVVEGVRYALNEGGITEMSAERVTYYGIEVGSKIHTTVEVVAPARGQLQQARIALEPWFTPDPEPHRVLPEVRRFFRDIAPQRIQFREWLADIDGTIARGKFWRLPIGYRELTQNNVFVWQIEPRPEGDFRMAVTFLSLPDEEPAGRIEWLAEVIAPFGARIERVRRADEPVPVSSANTPFYELLAREASAEFQAPAGTEFLSRSSSDSRFLRRRGIDAYGINPFAVDFFQSESIHAADERLRVAYFVRGLEFTRRLIRTWAFPA